MNRILTLLTLGIKNLESFKTFARKFRIAFENEIDKTDGMLLEFTANHYVISGYFKLKTGQLIYFCMPDVRQWLTGRPDTSLGSMTWRVAKYMNDVSGKNRRVLLADGMGKTIIDQVYMDENKISILVIDKTGYAKLKRDVIIIGFGGGSGNGKFVID